MVKSSETSVPIESYKCQVILTQFSQGSISPFAMHFTSCPRGVSQPQIVPIVFTFHCSIVEILLYARKHQQDTILCQKMLVRYCYMLENACTILLSAKKKTLLSILLHARKHLFENGYNKVVIELHVMQFWSEIIAVK